MDHTDHLAAVDHAGGLIQAALRAGPLDATVPSCPDWTITDLAVHVGQFAGFWAHVLCEGAGIDKPEVDLPPEGDAVVPWFDTMLGHITTMVHEVPATTEVWTWVEYDDTAAFVTRRVAHELAIHAFDAQLSRGTPEAVDAALAADGIDEVLDMIPYRSVTGFGSGETLHLHGTDRTDATDEWLLTLAADGLVVAREHAKGDLALRGTVADLELVLYGREPLGEVQHFGDDAVLDAWKTVFTF